jgi:hypothetical protein
MPHIQNRSAGSIVLGSSFIIGPLLLGASTFFWHNGEYGVTGGAILVLSMAFWIPAFIGLFEFFKNKMPGYAHFGFMVATIGCISGANFGMVGVLLDCFRIPHDIYLKEAAKHALAFNILLFWPGPLFPLSLLVLGVNLLRKGLVPIWTSVLICLGSLLFPVSRIARMETIAHFADSLLFAPLSYLGLRYVLSARHPK